MSAELEDPLAGVMRDLQGLSSGAAGPAAATLEAVASIAEVPRVPSGSIRQTTFRLGTIEPASVILLKAVLGPGIAVLTLFVSISLVGAGLSVDTLALGIIAFLLAQRILTTPQRRILPDGRREQRPELPRLMLEWSCIFSVFTFIVMALGLGHMVSSGALIFWYVSTPVALLLSNLTATRITRWWTTQRPTCACHIIIGATAAGLELAKRVQGSHYSGRFLGFFDFRDPSRLPLQTASQWAGNCTEVADFVRRQSVDAIYIALPISTAPRIAELLRQLRDTTASIYFIPANIFDFDLVQPRCLEIHGIPALAVCETPHYGLSALRKRVVDILLAMATLFALGPFMLVVAAAVKLSSRGPVLFKQRRYGLNGEEIFIYKFRSMTVCEDGPVVEQATRSDPRTTWLGRILRRASLDELPQILNVLEGKMSFVGPRPHAVAHNEMYRKLISGYMIRHKVRPGITGWAQVNGLRGETDTLEKMRRRVQYDIDYLNNWSLWLDIKILLKTAAIMLNDKQAY
jgi:putative colanic acid biosynthesis UDP-glucose lipid carrier transferase